MFISAILLLFKSPNPSATADHALNPRDWVRKMLNTEKLTTKLLLNVSILVFGQSSRVAWVSLVDLTIGGLEYEDGYMTRFQFEPVKDIYSS